MTDTIDTFAALNLPAPILSALAEVGYETPSPIQAACIPLLMAGRDILGEAQTGTGKTAAFALPMLAQIDLARKVPQVLVLTPTRELAIQVAEAFQKYAHHMPGFHVLPLYGGQSMVVQLRQLSRGAHIIVGTPGRVMDHLERKSLVLDGLKSMVLDEADEMLRMGFIDDVEWILEHTPATRQTALFSATMPEPIRRVAHRHLRDAQEVKIRSATSTVAATKQFYWQVRGADKLDALTRILEVEDDFDAALIFVRTKTATVELAEKLEARGYDAAALNGDMTQGLREQVIERLKSGALDIVVATDVAARGIDVPRIGHVINYDVPYDTEAYVHRIGRTGRAGRTGKAILFVAPRETRMLRAIEQATRQKIEPISLPTRAAVADRRVAQFKQQVLDALEAEKMDFFMDVVSQIETEQDLSMQEIAAVLAYMAQRDRPLRPEGAGWQDEAPQRSFDAPRERPAFEKKSYDKPYDKGQPREERSFEKPARENRDEILSRRRAFSEGSLQRYRIEVGRNQGVTPKDIVGAIANEGGIEGRNIGQIHLFDDYSTVELPSLPDDIVATLKRTRIRQSPLNIRLLAAGEFDEKREFKPKPKWDAERKDTRPTGDTRPVGDTRPPATKWSGEKKPFDGTRPPKAPYKSGDSKPPYKGGEKKYAGKPAFGKPKK
ncbi:MAG: DEAD/DEAH box helicase [Rhodocyclaceae bacterium]|nr:DEAD/DEAH box helicase [Rhodocyclaceae bacterium]